MGSRTASITCTSRFEMADTAPFLAHAASEHQDQSRMKVHLVAAHTALSRACDSAIAYSWRSRHARWITSRTGRDCRLETRRRVDLDNPDFSLALLATGQVLSVPPVVRMAVEL